MVKLGGPGNGWRGKRVEGGCGTMVKNNGKTGTTETKEKACQKEMHQGTEQVVIIKRESQRYEIVDCRLPNVAFAALVIFGTLDVHDKDSV